MDISLSSQGFSIKQIDEAFDTFNIGRAGNDNQRIDSLIGDNRD